MKNKSLHSMDTVFVLILFAVFVITALFISTSGAMAYKNAVNQMDTRFNRQTCISYITAKLRANNEVGKISIGELDGINALCITDTIGDEQYVTYIYQCDGMVREMFCNANISLDPKTGSALTEAKALEFSRDGNLFTVSLTDNDDNVITVYVNTV